MNCGNVCCGHKRKSRPSTMTSALPLEAVVEADFTNVGDVL